MSSKLNEIVECEICGNQNLISVLNLGLHPLCDDLIPINDDRVCLEYPIEILFCKTCITAHQRFQVPKQELFPSTYHYRSRFTADVLNGMKGLVESCEQKFGSLEGKKVLDIGCNDGSLLDFFKQKGCVTYGVEPTDAFQDAKEKGHNIHGSFLSEQIALELVSNGTEFDFITFTNVFAHIENLHEVLDSLRMLMNPNTVIVIENHYLGSVLSGSQFDTFYHEHPRTYSHTSFAYIAKLLGLSILEVEFPERYGGNIRVFLGPEHAMKSSHLIDFNQLQAKENQFFNMFEELRSEIECWKKAKSAILEKNIQLHGTLHAKAFPGRAAILIKLLGLDEQSISVVYEKPGSLKIGHYVPGTRIPICSDDEFLALKEKPEVLLNLAWHISKEIRAYMNKCDYRGSIIDILNAEDFQLEKTTA